MITLLRPNYCSHLITPPLGLGYLTSYLESKGHSVKVIDGLNLGWSNERIAASCSDVDIVGVSILSAYLSEAIDLTRILKSKGKTVVIGGQHVTALPYSSLKETGADYAVCGEGEITFVSLLEAILNNKRTEAIPGVVAADTETPLIKRGFIDDLDSLPFPDWSKIDPRTYRRAPHGGLIKNFPVAPITTSRGCPYECSFCASPKLWERKIRFRSPQNTVEEISYLVKNFGVREIHFEDDNLTLKKEHIASICELILERQIKISWATPNGVRADTIDSDILKLMRRSGCYYIVFGIESANEQILDNVKKKIRLESIERAITLAKKEGIMTQGFFIFGLPGETVETMRETINFAKKSGLDRAQFLLLDVLPGSDLWEKLNSSRCIDIKLARSYQDVTWVPDGLDKETLLKMRSLAFRKFFLRPRQLYSVIKYFKPSQLSFILKRLSDYRVFKT